MSTQEQIMSEAKRDFSQFLQPRATSRVPARAKPLAPELSLAPEWSNLRVLEPWENRRNPSGDPYNGIGARVAAGGTLHK
jgi:hypothetical protein